MFKERQRASRTTASEPHDSERAARQRASRTTAKQQRGAIMMDTLVVIHAWMVGAVAVTLAVLSVAVTLNFMIGG